MIFKIEHGKAVKKTNPDLSSIEEFEALNDQGLRYVFLMYDYESPYSRMPFNARKKEVLEACGLGKKNSANSFFKRSKGKLEEAIKVFKTLQYSPEFETLEAMKLQVEQWNELLAKPDKTDKEMALSAKVFDSMPEYSKRIKEQEELVGHRESSESSEEAEMTTLEKYHLSKGT